MSARSTYLGIALTFVACAENAAPNRLDATVAMDAPASAIDSSFDVGTTMDARSPDGGLDVGLVVDDAPMAADATDSSADPCAGAFDGSPCGPGRVCVDESCQVSRCGDGVLAPGEQCDDGNDVSGDGCEPVTCGYSCRNAADCIDAEPCNGVEICGAAHHCVGGAVLADGEICTTATISNGACRARPGGLLCVARGCGDGVAEGSEPCDDGNATDGDGCDSDCTFSCTTDADCDDSDACTGRESCTPTHVCETGPVPDCDDGDDCTADTCDPLAGCRSTLIDGDGDGYAPSTLGSCGADCDDTRPNVFPGAHEFCDAIDQDCDGIPTPPVIPRWFVDCDGDGFTASGATSVLSCTTPTPSACGGSWTQAPPGAGTTDCHDADSRVNPSATFHAGTTNPPVGGHDFDCDGLEEPGMTAAGLTGAEFCGPVGGTFSCGGSNGWIGAAPGCGESSTYSACTFWSIPSGGLLCERRSVTQAQTCR